MSFKLTSPRASLVALAFVLAGVNIPLSIASASDDSFASNLLDQTRNYLGMSPPLGETFNLGQSARSGLNCKASEDFEDPAVQTKGARAWQIKCDGWGDLVAGRLYSYSEAGDKATGPDGDWSREFSRRATCNFSASSRTQNSDGARRYDCNLTASNVPYVVLRSGTGNPTVVAEGLPTIQDIVETGYKVVSGAEAPPQSAGSSANVTRLSPSDSAALLRVEAQQHSSAEWISEHAFLDNQSWLFANSEVECRAMKAADSRDQAKRELCLGLNISNQQHFDEPDPQHADEAERHLDVADKLIATLNDPLLEAEAANCRAMHLRNQGKFKEAVEEANKAIGILASAGIQNSGGPGVVPRDSAGDISIDGTLASELNSSTRRGVLNANELTRREQGSVLQAQARYVVATSEERMHDNKNALGAIDAARKPFLASTDRNLRLRSAVPWLASLIDAESGRLELGEGHTSVAQGDFRDALADLHQQGMGAGTPVEGHLYLSLAKAEVGGGNINAGLEDYRHAFDTFLASRGSLGESADDAAPYLDLLIKQANGDAARSAEYRDQFFLAMQSISAAGTAETFTQRASEGDASIAALGRSLSDVNRQILIVDSEMKRKQDAGNYTDVQRQADAPQLNALGQQKLVLEQQLLNVNPRYEAITNTLIHVDQMQRALHPGELYVKTLLLKSGGYLAAITQDSAKVYAIPLNREQAAQEVHALRSPFDERGTRHRFRVDNSYKLFSEVFGPIKDSVAHARALVYEPDGPLVSLPADVFVVDEKSVKEYNDRAPKWLAGDYAIDLYDGTNWLARHTEISLSVSPGSFLASRNSSPSIAHHPFAGFGDPLTEGITDTRLFSGVVDKDNHDTESMCQQVREAMVARAQRLVGSSDTIRQIADRMGAKPNDVLLGAAFTDDTILKRKDLNDYRIIYFGTHGLLSGTAFKGCLKEPALVTSLGADDSSDGLLDTTKILQLSLDADMVLLPDCDTGGGGSAEVYRTGLIDSGEALSGLARSFIYAGGKSVVVSQWPVDVDSTQLMMRKLFQPGTTTEAGALHRAELSLMDERTYSHPYFWAAFSLLGDGEKPLRVN
jgi:CHAT domain-containing protein